MNYLFCLLALLPIIVYGEDPEVTINLGTIRGKTVVVSGTKVDQFLGIPYGTPPVDDLRFRRPVELTKSWNGTLIAQSMPKSCFQNLDIAHRIGVQKGVGPEMLSEDCLYLNIWTPRRKYESRTLPVMLWIHGGAFRLGSASDFNGAKLSKTTNTVVVIINYRLGILGFIHGNSDEMPGNMGLYDQRLAIKWTKENIREFGGDPNRITIFGQNAGSISVSHHLMSPDSWPYFKNAILMSGTAIDYMLIDREDKALLKSKALAKVVGCNVDPDKNILPMSTISCLRKVNPFELVKASSNETSMSAVPLHSSVAQFRLSGLLFYPVSGETFIQKSPQELWRGKQLKPNTDLLMTTVYNEFAVRAVIGAQEKPSDAMRRHYNVILGEFLTDAQIEDFTRLYFIGINERKYRNSAIQAATKLHADTFIQCPTNEFGDVFSSIESNTVSQVVFNYKSKNISQPACEKKYPCHSSDLPFTFGQVTDPKDQRASKNWMEMFGRFAHTGTTRWPKYYRTNKSKLVPVYNEFKGRYQLKNTKIGFRYFRCEIWTSMTSK